MKAIYKRQSNGKFEYFDETGKVIKTSKSDFEYYTRGWFNANGTFGKYSTCLKASNDADKANKSEGKILRDTTIYKIIAA